MPQMSFGSLSSNSISYTRNSTSAGEYENFNPIWTFTDNLSKVFVYELWPNRGQREQPGDWSRRPGYVASQPNQSRRRGVQQHVTGAYTGLRRKVRILAFVAQRGFAANTKADDENVSSAPRLRKIVAV